MKFKEIHLCVLVLFFVAGAVNSKRYGGGGSRGSSSGSKSSGWSIFGGSKKSPSTSAGSSNRYPGAPTSFNQPSAPPSRPVAHDTLHKASAPTSHSDPYSRQPAYNPSYNSHPSGSIPAAPHGVSVPNYAGAHHSSPSHSAPYPHVPNHPHPTNVGSSSFPSNPYHNAPVHPQNYPNTHSSFPSGGPPIHSQSYHPSQSSFPGGYSGPSYPQQSYHAPASAPFVPGKTIIIEKGSKGPGIGSAIATGVAGGVAAGATNAIVSHAISSIFRPSADRVHTYPNPPAVGTPTTSIVNNYYGNAQPTGDNNQGAPNSAPGVPNAPSSPSNNAGSPNVAPGATPGVVTGAENSGNANNNPSVTANGVATKISENAEPQNIPPINGVTDDEILKLTEELFDRQEVNLYENVEVNLQKTPDSNPNKDEAPEPLFKVKTELDGNPTVQALKALYDNYERDGTKKEIMTSERRDEEDKFLEIVGKSQVTNKMLGWLAEKKLIESDDFAQKDLLRRMWFSHFDETSSGFERIFLSEKFGDSGIVGMQNWIYFAHLESQGKANYLGYVDHLNLSGKGMLLKLNYETEGFTMKNATIFVGTSPELELALYTVCFHARPDNWCPVSLGGAKFFILTHSFRYYGKDLIDLGFPAF